VKNVKPVYNLPKHVAIPGASEPIPDDNMLEMATVRGALKHFYGGSYNSSPSVKLFLRNCSFHHNTWLSRTFYILASI